MIQQALPIAGAFLALLFAGSPAAAPTQGPSTLAKRDRSEATTLGGSVWILSWDDTVDGILDGAEKRCQVTLDSIDAAVTGRFHGPVLGVERECVFTGELAASGGLLILQQREPGYVCSYHLGRAGLGWSGTWRDSRGRAGTAALHRRPAAVPQ